MKALIFLKGIELIVRLRHSILQACYIAFQLVVCSAHFFFLLNQLIKPTGNIYIVQKSFSVDFQQAVFLLYEQVRKDAEE